MHTITLYPIGILMKLLQLKKVSNIYLCSIQKKQYKMPCVLLMQKNCQNAINLQHNENFSSLETCSAVEQHGKVVRSNLIWRFSLVLSYKMENFCLFEPIPYFLSKPFCFHIQKHGVHEKGLPLHIICSKSILFRKSFTLKKKFQFYFHTNIFIQSMGIGSKLISN